MRGAVSRAPTTCDGPSPSPDRPHHLMGFKVALTDHATRFAKRVAKEHVFVASGGRKGVFTLAPPINRLRDDNRADRSPSQDPAPVFSLQLLDQDRL